VERAVGWWKTARRAERELTFEQLAESCDASMPAIHIK